MAGRLSLMSCAADGRAGYYYKMVSNSPGSAKSLDDEVGVSGVKLIIWRC